VRHSWNIAAEFSDRGISGAKGQEHRSGLGGLLRAVTKREAEIVLTWSVDRLSLSLQDLLGLLAEFHARALTSTCTSRVSTPTPPRIRSARACGAAALIRGETGPGIPPPRYARDASSHLDLSSARLSTLFLEKKIGIVLRSLHPGWRKPRIYLLWPTSLQRGWPMQLFRLFAAVTSSID